MSKKPDNRCSSLDARLGYESLEPRIALSAAGLVEVGAQPAGALSGKIVYLSPGHGYQYKGSSWTTDRGESNEIVEPFGTQDQMTYLADYLFQAGATIVPMRPIGHQLNEIVLDNDSPGVTFSGTWSNSSGARYFDEDYGAVADPVHYRFASISGTETATATFTPTVTDAGFYPVYAWASYDTNRTNQLYKVNHSGGTTEVRIDHRMVGNGWVYLGTYHFDAGTTGSVVISNQSTAGGSVVIADAIRFGNGMGDLPDGPNGAGNSGGTLSGKPREDEASLLWVIRGIGQGVNTSSFFSVTGTDPNVSAPARMAEQMNANSNPFGTSVYLAIHSNAAGGRGAVGLISNSGSSYIPTPNQTQLAQFIGQQINGDMRALDGTFDYNWSTSSTNTLTGAYGEINDDDFINSSGVVEMDATLAEVAFHDNVEDANIMRDPRGRDAIARAMYQGLLQYFDVYGGLSAPPSVPTAPLNVHAESSASGHVTINWTAGPTTPTAVNTAPATGFRIYASTDGYGFDGGTYVAGGNVTSLNLSGYDPTRPYYFKVVAVNSGGESKASEVMSVLPSGGEKQVLIVNGFDRNHLSQDFRLTTQVSIPGSNVTVDRVYQRYNNSFDYVVQTHEALNAAVPGLHVESSSNEAVISGAVNLSDYDTVVWILGEESTANNTFNATEQTKVQQFIAGGGNLFLSGSEIGWDLDAQAGGVAFYEGTLKANFIADDANTYNVKPTSGGIFEGLTGFSFSNGTVFTGLDGQLYNVDYPDVIAPQAGAVAALTYSGGTGGTAAVQVEGTGGSGNIVMLAFPFETIADQAVRTQIFARVLEFFDFQIEYTDVDLVLDNDDGPSVYTETGSWTTSASPGFEGGSYRFAIVDTAATATWQFYAPFAGQGEVFVQYLAGANRADSTIYQIDTGNGIENVSINQKENSFTWISLGTFDFTAGGHTITLDAASSAGGSVVAADVVRIVIPASIAEPSADFDGDGNVDGRDFLTWQRGFGAVNGTSAQGDANADGAVDAEDLAIWQQQYGPAAPTQASLAVEAVDKALSSPDVQILGPQSWMGTFAISSQNTRQHKLLTKPSAERVNPVARSKQPIDWIATVSRSHVDIATSRTAEEDDFASDTDLDLAFGSFEEQS